MNSTSYDAFKELSIELTHKCALSCIYCSSSASIHQTEEIDINRLKEIILEVKQLFGVNTISLSGGETFLFSRFVDLYEFLLKENLKVLIYTSGVCFNSNEKLVSLSRDFIRQFYVSEDNPKVYINIQGHNRQLIEEINGVVGSFEIIEQSIKNIIAQGIALGAHIVPFKRNYQYLTEIVEYCRGMSFTDVSFLRFVPQGRGCKNEFYNTRHEFQEINRVIANILLNNANSKPKLDIRLGHPINFLFLMGQEDLYDREENHYCRGGLDAPLILPNGDVSMCPAWKDLSEFSAGNIYQQNFADIWDSHHFRVFRDFIKSGYTQLTEPCRSCGYLENCRGKCVAQRLLAQSQNESPSALDRRIMIGPDPQCFKGLIDQ